MQTYTTCIRSPKIWWPIPDTDSETGAQILSLSNAEIRKYHVEQIINVNLAG